MLGFKEFANYVARLLVSFRVYRHTQILTNSTAVKAA